MSAHVDRMTQISFIHKAPFTSYNKINFWIYTKLFQLFLLCGIYIVAWNIVHLLFTLALFQNRRILTISSSHNVVHIGM